MLMYNHFGPGFSSAKKHQYMDGKKYLKKAELGLKTRKKVLWNRRLQSINEILKHIIYWETLKQYPCSKSDILNFLQIYSVIFVKFAGLQKS